MSFLIFYSFLDFPDKTFLIIRLQADQFVSSHLNDESMVESPTRLHRFHADNIAHWNGLVSGESPLIDDDEIHFLIPVDRLHPSESISCIQNALDHAHNDDGVSAKQHKSTAVREKQIRNIYVTASGSKMSDEKVSYLMSIIEGLPNKFFTWNVKYIKVVDSIPGYGKNCRGMSVYAENTIYINSNISSNSMLRSSVYHEFGHYADTSNTGFTLRDCYTRHNEWRNVSSAEMSRLYSYYPGMSSLSDDNKNMEAFAMVFDAYYTGCITGEKVDIKSLCPEMYNTVSNFCN